MKNDPICENYNQVMYIMGKRTKINYVPYVTAKYQNTCNEKSTIYEVPADFYKFFWMFMFPHVPEFLYPSLSSCICKILGQDFKECFIEDFCSVEPKP